MEKPHAPSMEQLYVECQYLHEQCAKSTMPPDRLSSLMTALEAKSLRYEEIFQSRYQLFNDPRAVFSECANDQHNPWPLLEHDINTLVFLTPFYIVHHQGTSTPQHAQTGELHMHYVGIRSARMDTTMLPEYLRGAGEYIGLCAYGYAEYDDFNGARAPLLVSVPLGLARVIDHPNIAN